MTTYDGEHIQLLVHGEDTDVIRVDIEATTPASAPRITIVAWISEKQALAIAHGWAESVEAVLSGRGALERENALKRKNQALEREIYALRRDLAKRVLVEIPKIDDALPED